MEGGKMNRVYIKKKYADFKFSSILDKSSYDRDYITKGNTIQAHINIEENKPSKNISRSLIEITSTF